MRAAGVTQRDLAEMLGISEKHMSQLFRGRVQLTFPMADRIASLLGLRLHTRVMVPDEYRLSVSLDSAIGLIDRFPAGMRRAVVAMTRRDRALLDALRSAGQPEALEAEAARAVDFWEGVFASLGGGDW